MIKGDLYFRVVPPDQHNPVSVPISSRPSLPIWRAQPWVDVTMDIPTLAVKKTFTMLADTGADGTVLSLRDGTSPTDGGKDCRGRFGGLAMTG